MKKTNVAIVFLGLLCSSCAVVRPGEVGIKQTLGTFSKEVKNQGTILYNPLISKVVK